MDDKTPNPDETDDDIGTVQDENALEREGD